jgi:hypothetical protein
LFSGLVATFTIGLIKKPISIANEEKEKAGVEVEQRTWIGPMRKKGFWSSTSYDKGGGEEKEKCETTKVSEFE